ncbi:MAG TPA: aromatic ring-hydroxylating dioxygenase subunit alpha [Stellaceae bacterium]|jgi:nitrite reductase/ring-hydroxylating ferredoxin subunit
MDGGRLEGTAYGRQNATHDAMLTEVRAGTPCGEWLRRFWHPVALSSDATTRPTKVRLLGEDLILFRDRKGRPGLLYPRCMHRGTTLFYGKVEDEGIRCCYHGWLFGVDGTCLDQPCEPDHGQHRDVARQPWYPVEERYGLVFAYMGPPEKKPVLPRYDILENVPPDQELRAFDNGLGTGGDGPGMTPPCNWLQHWENIMDPFHVVVLHATFSGTQFVPDMAVMPDVAFEPVPAGMRYVANRKLDGGRKLRRVTEVMVPTLRLVPSPFLDPGPSNGIGWTVPVSDGEYKILNVSKMKKGAPVPRGSLYEGKRWSELTPEQHQDMPGDYEAQVGQGPIALHSEEHLATTDKGVAMLRRFLRNEIERVARGEDPAGVIFDTDKAIVKIETGNFFSG